MNNRFKSYNIIPVYVFGLVGMAIAIALFWADYWTSFEGFSATPTQKIESEWVPYLVALGPQVFSVVFGYMYQQNTEKRGKLIMSLACTALDVTFDTYYKSNSFTSNGYWAFAESILIFTVFSEYALIVITGFLLENLVPCVDAISTIFKALLMGDQSGSRKRSSMSS